jgi:glycerophosphoryl diester phosphodiesterase
MASLQECTSDRAKRCAREEDKGYHQCTEERDQGYNACTQNRDDGYRDCCDWAPCSWFCDAWVWVSHVVCVVWTWIANVVCVAWKWLSRVVCVLWVYVSAPICLIPGIGKSFTDVVDAGLRIGSAAIGSFFSGVFDFVAHPVESMETIISMFRGCPSITADQKSALQIISHHGAPLELPENTIQSCVRALQLGANALEVDICMTLDGHLILWHDWDPDDLISIARQMDVPSGNAFKPDVPVVGSQWRKPTIELTLDQFREYFSYADQRDSVTKVKWGIDHGPVELRIPTLKEFFSAALEWSQLRTVYLDIKMPSTSALRYAGPMAEQISALIGSRSHTDLQVVVMVPDSLVLQVMKARAAEKGFDLMFTWDVEFPPGVILNPRKYSAVDHAISSMFHNSVASVGKPTIATAFSWRTYRRTIEYDIRRWNEVNVAPATNAGIPIQLLITWTINDRDWMTCLAKMGVSGIITDNIADLVGVATATGRV